MSTNKRTSLAHGSSNGSKKGRSDDVKDASPFWTRPPFVNLQTIKKADSVAEDGKPSLLFDLQEHVLHSQHRVEPKEYLDYGEAMNRGEMWECFLREKIGTPRVTTGFSRTRYRLFASEHSTPLKRLYEQLSTHAEIINTHGTQYDAIVGKMGYHCDNFAFRQEFRSILTQGSSKKEKYIRFQECGLNGRWVELWVPNGSLLTLTKHGSGADRPRRNGNCIPEATANEDGVRFLQHAIFRGQCTHASFLEYRSKPGCTNEQVLFDLHSALAASPVVKCYNHPPFPTKAQIGQASCLKMTAQEKGILGNFAKYGVWPLESSDDAQSEYAKDGFWGQSHPDAPPDMLPSQVYCSFCDVLVEGSNHGTLISRDRLDQHCKSSTHMECKEAGSREAFNKNRFIMNKKTLVEELCDDGIEMGNEDHRCYCRVCKIHICCARKRANKTIIKSPNEFHIDKTVVTKHVQSQNHTMKKAQSSK